MSWRTSILAAASLGLALACVTEDPGSSNTNSKPNTGGPTTDTPEESGGDMETEDSGTETGETCDIAETTEVEGCPELLGEGFCTEGGVHVDQDSEIDWGNNPPHSGDHYPTWKNWGEHDEAIPRGNWVHNLEHGYTPTGKIGGPGRGPLPRQPAGSPYPSHGRQ